MTDEVKRTVGVLRYCEESGARCGECPSGASENGVPNCCSQSHIADLIESLSAELEQVTQERDGLSIMLTAAESAAETYKRVMDTAIADINMVCQCDVCTRMCKYDKPNPYCECADFEWRGVKEDSK